MRVAHDICHNGDCKAKIYHGGEKPANGGAGQTFEMGGLDVNQELL